MAIQEREKQKHSGMSNLNETEVPFENETLAPQMVDLNTSVPYNSTEESETFITSTDTELLKQTLRFYGSVFICLLLLFCFLRSP